MQRIIWSSALNQNYGSVASGTFLCNQGPITRSVQLPYHVTAFLQTGLFLDYFSPQGSIVICDVRLFARMHTLVNFFGLRLRKEKW